MTTQAEKPAAAKPDARAQIEAYEKMMPRLVTEHGGAKMMFSTPSVFTLWRAQTIRQKEPWTLEWIETFGEGDVFVDCGANVGMYTIWAAATRKAQVFAFEPEAQNFAVLNRNIMLNDLSERTRAFCMGLSDVSGLSELHMQDLRIGGSCHSVGEALDYKHEPLATRFTQGCVVARLDDLVAEGSVPPPAHIKIDVDGFEPKVIAGARKTLEGASVQSVLIELNQNLEDHRAMVGELAELGFKIDPAQVKRAERQEGAFKGVAEHIFRR